MPQEEPPAESFAPEDVTALLAAARAGDEAARDRLYGLVYGELRRIARRHLRRREPGATVQTTTLVHEAYLRLARPDGGGSFVDRAHFFAVASRAMRQILIDRARALRTAKRGAGAVRLEFDEAKVVDPTAVSAAELVDLDEALSRLERLHPRLGRVVELHFFGGMTFAEVGEALSVTDRTAKRDWRMARAFLYAELAERPSP